MNHMRFKPCHVILLVINKPEGSHTHAHEHTSVVQCVEKYWYHENVSILYWIISNVDIEIS